MYTHTRHCKNICRYMYKWKFNEATIFLHNICISDDVRYGAVCQRTYRLMARGAYLCCKRELIPWNRIYRWTALCAFCSSIKSLLHFLKTFLGGLKSWRSPLRICNLPHFHESRVHSLLSSIVRPVVAKIYNISIQLLSWQSWST